MRNWLFITLLLASAADAARMNQERHYQDLWCDERDGEKEVILSDRTRVDCLLDEYAVEVDFANKWAEAVGQAQYYAYMTGRKPGVLLIMEKDSDLRYLYRLSDVIEVTCPRIKVWTIHP